MEKVSTLCCSMSISTESEYSNIDDSARPAHVGVCKSVDDKYINTMMTNYWDMAA